MFVKLLIISAVILVISFAGLGIRMLLKAHGRLPETHISRNREIQKRGITCARDIYIGCRLSDDFEECVTCGARKL